MHPLIKSTAMQKLQLSIPEPCHENWHAMTPTEQGRFCNACTKEVIDFSMMTDTEVLNYFSSLSHEKVCGRAMPSQLDRVISRPEEPKRRLFWYWNYIVMFFLIFTRTQGSKAQVTSTQGTEQAPVKPAEISRGDIVITQWEVKGKVTDNKNNPVPFATVSIKGKRAGTSADANGNFGIRITAGDVLVVSSVGYKEIEMPVATPRFLNFVLEESGQTLGGFMIVKQDRPAAKSSALFRVKEESSGSWISQAKIIIAKAKSSEPDTGLTDNKGIYTLANIKKNEEYFIRVEAAGYESNEFSIKAKELKSKKEWDVLLTKKQAIKKYDQPSAIRLGGIQTIIPGQYPVYVVDGSVVPDVERLNVDDIDEVFVLKTAEAAALYGNIAANGAIVITTRKSKIKSLDTVSLKTDINYLRGRLGGMSITGVRISRYAEIKARISTILTDSLKIFPNPVQRGSSFNVALKLNQPGEYSIQLADATGRIILQKRVNAVAKQQTEQITADSRWPAGICYVRIFNNKNQLISKSSFVVR